MLEQVTTSHAPTISDFVSTTSESEEYSPNETRTARLNDRVTNHGTHRDSPRPTESSEFSSVRPLTSPFTLAGLKSVIPRSPLFAPGSTSESSVIALENENMEDISSTSQQDLCETESADALSTKLSISYQNQNQHNQAFQSMAPKTRCHVSSHAQTALMEHQHLAQLTKVTDVGHRAVFADHENRISLADVVAVSK